MARLNSPMSPTSPIDDQSLLARVMSPTAHKILTLATCCALALYFSLPPSHDHLELTYPRRASTPTASPPPIPNPLPRAVLGRDEPLPAYLDARFPNAPDRAETMATMPDGSKLGPHVWLTMADGKWAQSGARALEVFVRRLNAERRVKLGEGARETVLVTLCLDDGCLDACVDAGMYCYGGYRFNKPPLLYASTWPKLAAMVELLPTRDLFFVDSDVSFKTDPYPVMEPLMKDFDLVIQENDAFDHFNTGWFWIRRGQAASDAWNEVLEMDKTSKSRDQNRFNEVLGTAQRRQPPTPGAPLLNEFVALNGLRVHILDPSVVYSWHFERDRPDWSRHRAVALHMTCGDDEPTKVFVQKALGFWGDVDGYYARPPRLVSFDHLGGTQAEVEQMVRIGLAVAHYAGRALMPPSHVVFTDIANTAEQGGGPSPISSLPSYSAFPWAHMPLQFYEGVDVVEPGYAAHAAKHILGGSVLAREALVQDGEGGGEERRQGGGAAAKALSLLTPVPLDLSQATSLSSLISLILSPPYSTAQHLRLTHFTTPSLPNPDSALHLPLRPDGRGPETPPPGGWRSWSLPEPVGRVVACANLSVAPGCETICKTEFGWKVTVQGEWPSVAQLEEQGAEAGKKWGDL